jgi:hypothetical protein
MEEDKFISGEQYQALKTKKPSKNSGLNNKIVLIIIAVLAYSVIIFYIGIAYQKHHNKTPIATVKTTNGQFGNFGGQGGNFADRLFGSVTTVSPTSITVANPRTGSTTTVTINSSTTITDNQQTVSESSISDGLEVMIALDPSNTSVANSITVVNLPTQSSAGSQT